MRALAVTAMRNEGPFVVEWVAWLRQQGFDAILVYSNDCDDGTDAVLEALAPLGVTHVPQQSAPGRSVQWSALKAAWAHPLRAKADWAMVLDCDEFPVPLGPLRLRDIMEQTAADALAFPWRLFGHAGHIDPPQDLTTAAFDRAAPADLGFPVSASFVKSAFRVAAFDGFGVHRPKQGAGAAPRWHGPDDAPLPAAWAQTQGRIALWPRPKGAPLVQLNHYSVRSVASFLVKRDRGLPNRHTKDVGLAYWAERNFNTEPCTAMAPHLSGLRTAVAEARALPGVAEAEAAARNWHRDRLATLLQDPDAAHLFGRLCLLPGSAILPEALTLRLVRHYQDAQRAKDAE